MATIIRVDGTRQPVVPEGEDGEMTLEQIQTAVGGRFTIAYQVDDEGYYAPNAPMVMLVNENGIDLFPKNPAASRLNGRPIHGPVVYCTRREAGFEE